MLLREFTELVSMKEPCRLAVFKYFEEMTDSSDRCRLTIGLIRGEGPSDVLELSRFLSFPDERSFFILGQFCHKLFRDFELL